MLTKKFHYTPLQIAVHVGAWLPALWLAFAFYTHRLTANPIQAATQFTGKTALVLLVLSLACTPLNTVFGFKPALKLRRPLGLYAFIYVTTHFLIFTGVDYQFNLKFLWADVGKKAYVWVGLAAGLILLALALTSFRWWQKWLGKNWKRLHQWVYFAALLVILHYAWAKKGDLFRLQGDILGPLLFGLLVVLLLVLRLSPVKKVVQKIRNRLAAAARGPAGKVPRVWLKHEPVARKEP